jgi:hypothetical protein
MEPEIDLTGPPVDPGVAVPLRPGDRICIGAWTVLTVEA